MSQSVNVALSLDITKNIIKGLYKKIYDYNWQKKKNHCLKPLLSQVVKVKLVWRCWILIPEIPPKLEGL